jgi:hypothetical protein
LLFFKGLKKTVEGAILNPNGSKDNRPGGWFPGAKVPESGAQVRACDKRREGAAERKKEAKKERQVQRYEGKVYEGMAMAMARTRVLRGI